ncbi:unnamed protein product [Albugo candida]|uniref:Vacuolar protein 8 n=1 Tax=Albugo candida TaxID=65357 RepID=A0A024GRE4_9STRA|nr:unnamed protein product [Albugo candida]|eukprot:CCI49144.1 unnamed protein product [Albugo candida]
MSHHLSQNARNTMELLEELERDKELDVLRIYLTRFNLFPRNRDPASAPIRYEELKDLVKHWNLHRQRNFWKNHTTRDDLVRTLHTYINTNTEARKEREGKQKTSITMNKERDIGEFADSISEVVAHSPTAPNRNNSLSLGSPRTRSISKSVPKSPEGPSSTHVFNMYSGDIFAQRGDYENGMIYSSRLSKPEENTKSTLRNDDLFPDQDHYDHSVEGKISDASGLRKNSVLEEHVLGSTAREISLKRECAFTIYYFTTVLGNERQMVNEGCLFAISCLAIVDDLEVKKYCAVAIFNLTCDLDLCAKMIHDGVLLTLMELVKSQNEEIRRHTSMALCRFSHDRNGQYRLIQEGCTSAILSMLNSSDMEAKESCIKALINIASFSGSPMPDSVVQSLTKMAKIEELKYKRFAALAVYNLSVLPGSRAKILDEDVLNTIFYLSHSSKDLELSINIAQALRNFSGIASNLETLGDIKVLETIKVLLKEKEVQVIEHCAITLSNISSNSSSIHRLVDNYLIQDCIQLSKFESIIVQENVALILANIATLRNVAQLKYWLQLVPFFISLFKDGNCLAQQYTLMALAYLVSFDEVCTALIQVDFLSALSVLSSTSNDKTKELCASLYLNISHSSVYHVYLMDESVINSILRLLRKTNINKDGVEIDDDSTSPAIGGVHDKMPLALPRSQECALGCFYNLSFTEGHSAKLAESTLIKVLIAMFTRTNRTEDAISWCAAILANLTFDASCRKHFIEIGCVRLIRKLMHSVTKDTLLCCATAACNLAGEALEKTAVLSILIDLSTSQHTIIINTCAIALYKLAAKENSRSALSKTPEVFPTLISMMRSGNENVQIRSAATLCNLAMEKNTRTRHIWTEGTVPNFIVNALLRVNSATTKEICACALYNLLTHDEHRISHIKDGVLYALIKLSRLDSKRIQILCVDALYNLSCEHTMLECLMEVNVAQVVTKICENESSDQEIRRVLAACLMNLSSPSRVRVSLVENGALVAVSKLLQCKVTSTLSYCAATLSNLSSEGSNCEAMVTNNLPKGLLDLASCSDRQQSTLAINALCNMSRIATLHERLDEAGIFQKVVAIILNCEEEEIQSACMYVLYNFAGSTMLRKKLIRSDIVAGMQHMLLTSTKLPLTIIDMCAEILSVMSEDSENWIELVGNGAIGALRLLSTYCSIPAMVQCAYAISQLVQCEQHQTVAVQEGSVDIVASILTHQNLTKPTGQSPDIARFCSFTLRALSTYCSEALSLIDGNSILFLIRGIISIGFVGAYENCVITIYNIVMRNDAELSSMVGNGVVRLLIELCGVCTSEVAPACAIGLAHIQHLQHEKWVGGVSEIEAGLIQTLLSMVDIGPSKIQHVELVASKLPTLVPPVRLGAWSYLPIGNKLSYPDQYGMSWKLQSPLDEEVDVSPSHLRTFMHLYPFTTPALGATIQDSITGDFCAMRIDDGKYKLEKVYPTPAAPENHNNFGALTQAISELLISHAPETSESSKDSLFADKDTVLELRQATTVKSKSPTRVSRAGSRMAIDDETSTRRESKIQRASITSLIDEKRPSIQRSDTSRTRPSISSPLSEVQLVLPKL